MSMKVGSIFLPTATTDSIGGVKGSEDFSIDNQGHIIDNRSGSSELQVTLPSTEFPNIRSVAEHLAGKQYKSCSINTASNYVDSELDGKTYIEQPVEFSGLDEIIVGGELSTSELF